MSSVLAELRQWADTLPYWERAALDKVLSGVKFTDSEYDELLKYLLEDKGLAASAGKRPPLKFFTSVSSIFQSSVGRVQLTKIFNMQNINALVSGQTLTFGSQLTAIFGANGSGKSGYARVLGCAGFTRGDREILPDVTQPSSTSMILSADIEISDGTCNKIIHYQIGGPYPGLSSFYVFDSTSVRVHLTGTNTFSFSPAGLSCLTELAEVTDKVRERLRARVEECEQQHHFLSLFQGKSAVTELIVELGSKTDLEKLRQTSMLTAEEIKQIELLDIEIARLKARDIPAQVSKLSKTIEDLQSLIRRLNASGNKLSEEVITEIKGAVELYIAEETLAQGLGVDQFKSEHFTQIGSVVWQRFVEAAKALAEAEGTLVKPYPQPEDHCLLCQQPLSTGARELLLHLWEFLKGEIQERCKEAQIAVAKKRSELEEIDLDFFNDQLVSYRHLEEQDISLLKNVAEFIEGCRQRREIALRIIASHTKEAIINMPVSPTSQIEEVIRILEKRKDELEKDDSAQKIAELEQQLLGLRHREVLAQHLSDIEDYVRKRIWAQQAAKIGGSTQHITRKYNEVFGLLVKNRYIELFEETLKDLERPLKVKVKTMGRKGETYKQIVLETDPTTPPEKATPDKVLSEGEKRCVAVADFLTEVALDPDSKGIILDDPVTSLDIEWRETIASILAKGAKHRQVIVFTHDLPFLYFLKKYSEQNTVEVLTHWIQQIDGKPGYVFLDNSPALEREYCKTTRAREFYRQAKNATAEQQENFLRLGFGALRTCYEAFIIYELFEEVVMRFDVRVSFGRLKHIKWDESIANRVNAKCELLSRYIEGHLQSNGYIARTDSQMLLSEIEYFEALSKGLKELKKEHKV